MAKPFQKGALISQESKPNCVPFFVDELCDGGIEQAGKKAYIMHLSGLAAAIGVLDCAPSECELIYLSQMEYF
jgi:hypothetical protein